MSAKDDSEARSKLAAKIEAKLTQNVNFSGEVDSSQVRAQDPALADVLDEFLLSKSWRTDPNTTAKQVAEVMVARDQESKLAGLLAELDDELKKDD